MARFLLAVVVAAVALHAASAHTCLRNGAPGATTKVADPACGLTDGPCGGTKVGPTSLTVTAGMPVEINWIKNLNHYNAAAPGNFSLYGYNHGMRSPLLYSVQDTNTPSLTPYSTTLQVPAEAQPGEYTIQLIFEVVSA